jgi:hypothetical protein
VKSILTSVPGEKTRVWEGSEVLAPRLVGMKTARTSSGRPMPMLSATRASKNPRAGGGRRRRWAG